MVIYNTAPFNFRVEDWMVMALVIMGSKYIMQQRMKTLGQCDEHSIWKSQQMFFVGGPLQIMSLLQGTNAAVQIGRKVDKSWGDPADLGDLVTQFVKMWTSVVLFYCGLCTLILVTASVFGFEVGATQWVSLFLLVIISVTVVDPVMDIWGVHKTLKAWREDDVSFPSCKLRWYRESKATGEDDTKRAWCKQFGRWIRKTFFQCEFSFRKMSWTLRWITDLGLPLLVLLLNRWSLPDLIGMSAWAQGMGGFGRGR